MAVAAVTVARGPRRRRPACRPRGSRRPARRRRRSPAAPVRMLRLDGDRPAVRDRPPARARADGERAAGVVDRVGADATAAADRAQCERLAVGDIRLASSRRRRRCRPAQRHQREPLRARLSSRSNEALTRSTRLARSSCCPAPGRDVAVRIELEVSAAAFRRHPAVQTELHLNAHRVALRHGDDLR